ncbi:MAG: NlpC/P60 family protein [Verrucomicrobiota bacterium]
MHWTTPLLTKPWKEHAFGPDEFDCWGLVHFAYRTQKGIDLPQYLETSSRAFREQGIDDSDYPQWLPIAEPEDFALVGMGMGKRIAHVGLHLHIDGGLVLHCPESTGVVIQSVASLKKHGWRTIRFYRWQNLS